MTANTSSLRTIASSKWPLYAPNSKLASIACLPADLRRNFLASLDLETLEMLLHDWALWARPSQLPPEGDWRIWLFLGGRGAGKTRAGAEWVHHAVWYERARRVCLLAPSFHEAREVMIEGHSGLMALSPPQWRPRYEPTRRRLEWPNKAVGYVFSAEEPEALRGPQFDLAWADELAAWGAQGALAFANMELALRLGERGRICVTTTPRPVPLLKGLMQRKDCVITRARTHDNRHFLAGDFVKSMQATYGGTALGRQELDGEWIEDLAGALWTRDDVERARAQAEDVSNTGNYDEIIVAIDPAMTSGPCADLCGIVAVGAKGTGSRKRAVVLADHSAQGLRPHEWAARAASLAMSLRADYLLAEANQGGELVAEALRLAAPELPVRLVHARTSKRARAELVAALYAQNRVHHRGAFAALEDEMCRFGAPGFSGSPDRLDALVWAVSALLLNPAEPRLRRL